MVRDEEGKVVEARVYKLGTSDPYIAEFMAVHEALMLCLQNRWTSIVCETDAKSVVQCLKDGNFENLHWSINPVFKDICRICISFNNVNFSWCKRESNQLTHETARRGADNEFLNFLKQNLYLQSFLN